MENSLHLNDEACLRGYRERAARLRAFADTFTHEGARHDLFALARQWDEVADRLAWQLKQVA